MGMLTWLLHRERARSALHEDGRVDEMIERVVAVNPRLRMAQHYRERLASAVSLSVGYIDELIGSLPGAARGQCRSVVIRCLYSRLFRDARRGGESVQPFDRTA
jgi:hypothetical protein